MAATPKGLHPSAQGCRTRLPWVAWRAEDESVIFNLEEVAACTAPTSRRRASERHNPFGVGSHRAPGRPKVAEYGNLGLWDAIPLGLGPKCPTATNLDRSSEKAHRDQGVQQSHFYTHPWAPLLDLENISRHEGRPRRDARRRESENALDENAH